jgi:imidazole glycerol-phosphate synthase subunit HisH
VVAVVDYGMGNLRSVERALRSLGAQSSVTQDHDELRAADRLILPGVGAFGLAMERLRASGLATLLTELVQQDGKPVLGICLGMQLVCRDSHEHGHHDGLGWIPATVRRFTPPPNERLRVPHVGWNDVIGRPDTVLTPDGGTFYFVHSYYADCDDGRDVAATCLYGKPFPACIERANVLAAQFHPEKSQDEGLEVLKRYLEWEPYASAAAA